MGHQMKSRFVLVQISDPHFGSDLRNAKASLHPGYNCHDIALCHALDELLLADIYDLPGIEEDDVFHLLMGGDLASLGKDQEFDTAHAYIHSSTLVQENGVSSDVGLEQPADRYWAVAGNHDHWYGKYIYPLQRGFSSALFPQYFESPPWVYPVQQGELELVFCGVDSNSMFEGSLVNLNPGAGGGFSPKHRTEFRDKMAAAMSAPLSPGCKRRTSVLLCHHAFSDDGPASPLRRTCVSWLVDIAAEYDIPFVFTGHTHRMWTHFIQVPTPKGIKQVREIRSPTTLQYPPRPDSSKRRPGLWIHQIALSGTSIEWTAHLYLYNAGAFQTSQNSTWFKVQL